jgi:hypothetical protein
LQNLGQHTLVPTQLKKDPHLLGPVVIGRLVEGRVPPVAVVDAEEIGTVLYKLGGPPGVVGVAAAVVQFLVQVSALYV